MKYKNLLLCSALLCGSYLSLQAQSFVPPNMDFEMGTTANWTYYTGSVATGFIYTLATSPATPGEHTLMSGTGTDAYGGFPEVGNGSYSLKLLHDITGSKADAASYNVALPGTSTYSIIYQYAAVLEDPSHAPTHQPIFEVQAIDSTTGTVFFDSIIYDPTPGFIHSTVAPNPWYKAWTNVSVDLSAYSGKTVTMKFIAAGCSDGGHFGYAYIDIAGVFETSTTLPLHAPSVTLTGPSGYSSYKWTDATTFLASYGTTASVTIAAPLAKKKYALILTPVAGHGTVDTVYKIVDITSTLGVSTTANSATFNLVPNPTSGATKIEWANQQTGTAQLQVTDVTGRVVNQSVLNIDAPSGTKQIDLSGLANGVYLMTIKSEHVSYSSKVVIQK